MSFTVTCYTLFDVTQTGIINRNRPEIEQDDAVWQHKRNTQCNFDTILQAISLRSQPEILDEPKKIEIRFDEFKDFGYLLEQQGDEKYNCWVFDFSIQHPRVFDDGITELGALYSDCDEIPMIKCETSWDKLPKFLDSSDEMRNIFFKVGKND